MEIYFFKKSGNKRDNGQWALTIGVLRMCSTKVIHSLKIIGQRHIRAMQTNPKRHKYQTNARQKTPSVKQNMLLQRKESTMRI